MSADARIGIDITPTRMTAVRMVAGKRLTMTAAVVVRREHMDEPLNEHDVKRLVSAMARSGCDSGDMIVSAPVAHTLCAALEIPVGIASDDAMRIAKMELARGSKLSPESIECGWWDVPAPARATETRHALAIGLSHVHAEHMIRVLESGGIAVNAIDTRPCAIARALRSCTDGASIVADIGDEHTLLFMINDGVVLYSRVIADLSLTTLSRKMKERCGLDDRAIDLLLGDHAHAVMNAPNVRGCVTNMYETLSAEISKSVNYATHRYPGLAIKNVSLSGRGAVLAGLRNRLESPNLPCIMPCVAELCSLTGSTFDLGHRTDLVCAIGLAGWRAEQMRGAA